VLDEDGEGPDDDDEGEAAVDGEAPVEPAFGGPMGPPELAGPPEGAAPAEGPPGPAQTFDIAMRSFFSEEGLRRRRTR